MYVLAKKGGLPCSLQALLPTNAPLGVPQDATELDTRLTYPKAIRAQARAQKIFTCSPFIVGLCISPLQAGVALPSQRRAQHIAVMIAMYDVMILIYLSP